MRSNFGRSSSAWMGWRPSPGVVGVLVALVAAFAAIRMSGQEKFVLEHLALSPRRALGPEPWQLFTHGFVHFSFGPLLSTVVAVWFFGTPVEQRGGRAYLFKVLIGATLLSGLAAAALGWIVPPGRLSAPMLVGGIGASAAAIAAFATVYGKTPILLFGVQQMRASTTAYIFLGITALMFLWEGNWLGLVAAAAGAAWGTWGADLRITRLRIAWDKARLWRLRRRYKVISGGRDSKRYLN
jgi:membrane associated rhomboid family serine protease